MFVASFIYKISIMKNFTNILFGKAQGLTSVAILILVLQFNLGFSQNFPIVDTDQQIAYDTLTEIALPAQGDAFYGQDANYSGNQPS